MAGAWPTPRLGIVAILLQKWLSDYKYNSLAKIHHLGFKIYIFAKSVL